MGLKIDAVEAEVKIDEATAPMSPLAAIAEEQTENAVKEMEEALGAEDVATAQDEVAGGVAESEEMSENSGSEEAPKEEELA